MKKYFLLFLSIGLTFSFCKKKEADPVPQVQAKFYFKATIDGQIVEFKDGVNGYGSGAGSSGGSAPSGGGAWSEEQSMNLMNPFSTVNQVGVIIIKNFPAVTSQCSDVEAMFHTGTYPYGKQSGALDAVDGVAVYYVDGNGTYWSSDQGAGTQTGSTFEITEHIGNTDGYSLRISKATFSCILYDGAGNSKTLTNGVIRSRSVQC